MREREAEEREGERGREKDGERGAREGDPEMFSE